MKTVTTTITRPKCKVHGCPTKQLTRKSGMCAKHRARVQRTGRAGPAANYFRTAPKVERPARSRVLLRVFRSVVSRFGPSFYATSVTPGTLYLTGLGGTRRAIAISRLLAFQRRGWTKMRPELDQYRITVTPHGRKALEV